METDPLLAPTTVLGVIPARLASTRLARKVLRIIASRPMLAWVYEAASACPQLDRVIVATDSDEVANLCHENNWPVQLTSTDLASGTDRVHAGQIHEMSTRPNGNAIAVCRRLCRPFAFSRIDERLVSSMVWALGEVQGAQPHLTAGLFRQARLLFMAPPISVINFRPSKAF